MNQKISFNYKGKNFSFIAKKCGKFNTGLMFRTQKTMPCFFEFNQYTNILFTSFFVFFPFIMVWLDKKNKVIEIRKIRPFTLSINARKAYTKVLEIPINAYTKPKIGLLVGD